MSALETLVARLRERAVPASGVVGYVGADIPRELVEAAGLAARAGSAEPGPPIALRRVDPRAAGRPADPARPRRRCSTGQLPIDFLLLGARLRQLGAALHARFARLARADLPELWFVDLLHLPTETTAAYNLDRLRELVGVLERWSGQPVTDESLRTAIRDANRTRTAAGAARRASARLSPAPVAERRRSP